MLTWAGGIEQGNLESLVSGVGYEPDTWGSSREA